MDTILVTGSNGYLGYAVAQRLAASHHVVGFDRRQPSHPPPVAECLYVDLTSEASLRRGLEAVRELQDRAGNPGQAALGLGNSLAAVNRRAVHLLLISERFAAAGTPRPASYRISRDRRRSARIFPPVWIDGMDVEGARRSVGSCVDRAERGV